MQVNNNGGPTADYSESSSENEGSSSSEYSESDGQDNDKMSESNNDEPKDLSVR